MYPDAHNWIPSGTPGISTKLLGAFTERGLSIGQIKLDAGATFNTGSRNQIEILFMSKGNFQFNGKNYSDKTGIELLPTDSAVDLKAIEESLFLTVKLPKF
jgi:redox-sensitive bicupin YhaK (pirin superfamily)